MRGVLLGCVLIAVTGAPARLRPVAALSDRRRAEKGRRHARPERAHAAAAGRQAGLLGHLARRRIPTGACPAPASSSRAASRSAGRRSAATSAANLPGGLPYQPWAATLANERRGRRQPRRSARALPARQSAAALDAAAPHQGGAHAEAAGAALRSERDVPADLHRRPAAARGHDARLERLLDRALGRRHARRPDRGLPRRPVDRHRAAAR